VAQGGGVSLFDDDRPGEEEGTRPDPRERPEDPAGTKPRHDPDALLPHTRESLLTANSADAAAGPESEPDVLPEKVVAATEPEAAEPVEGNAPHAARFQFVYGVLIGVGIAALVAAVLAFSGSNDRTQTVQLSNWSAWQPTRGAGDPIQQIIDHVGPEYRLASGKQAVAVTGGPSQVQGIPLVVALRSDPANNGDVSILDNKNVVLYRMCGLGKDCSIKEGKPSKERGLLMRREALELALYTFNYVADIDAVTILMPPAADPKTKKLSHVALLFRPQDVQPSLQNPLADTLPGPTPSVRTLPRSPNVSVIKAITGSLQYDFSITQDNANNRGYLVLDTIP
jgi:hypothetical protein